MVLSEKASRVADELMAIIDEAPDLARALELEDITQIED